MTMASVLASSLGPPLDLFLPGCWLRRGENEIVVLDLERSQPAALWATSDRRR
jgi:hypothetical protein